MKHRLKLLAASLALTTFLPMTPTFAAEEPVPAEEVATPTEEVSAPAEEVASPEETAVEAETNVDYLNYLELEDFIISAERIPTNKWDTPANVTVITSQEIEDNHYQSVGEALAHVTGYVAGQLTGGDRVLTLIDGRRNGIYPPMQMIERIEVLKGGSSALYGSDAFNGVINIVTKKGTKNETSIDLNTGTWRQHRYTLTNQGTVGKFSWIATGDLFKTHPYEFKGGMAEDNWKVNTNEASTHIFAIRLDQRFTERDSLTFDFAHNSGRTRSYNTRYHYYPNYPSNSGVYNTFSLTYNFKEGTSTPGWLRYYYFYSTNKDYGTENPNNRSHSIEYQNGWEFGQHKIIAGLGWYRNSVKDVLSNIDTHIDTKSFYLQDTISMGDKWTVIPGLRYDYSSEAGKNWSPKIAANYRPDEKTKIYASWGKSYNAPTLYELYSDWSDLENFQRAWEQTSPTFYFGNSKLRPEKGHTTIIGIEHDFDEKTGFDISFFENRMRDLKQWNFDGPFNSLWGYRTPVDYYTNDAVNYYPLKSRGIEINFRQKIDDHFSYNLGYSHTHTHMESPLVGDISFYRPQPNSYRLGLNYKNRGLKINLHGIMASGINTNFQAAWWKNTNSSQAYPKRRYAVLNLNVSYDVNDNLTFYFKALNLTNQHYSNSVSNVYDFGDAYTYDWHKQVYPGSGREFIYGVNYRF